jgi:pimeloyl-ACP methyl ester carboxylesterase
VIAGQYDRVTPPQAAEALAQMLAQSQWLLLKRAGHAAFLSHTTQVVDAIQAFLSAHGRGVSDACRSNAAPPAP